MSLLYYIFFFLLALGPLIAFHELGHYAAARICNVKVLRYCLGWGKPFISTRIGPDQTEWGIAPFPIGGYVKLLGEDPDAPVESAEAHRALNRQSPGKRMFISAAGPAANFVLAIVLYWGLNLHGVEEPVARMAAPAAGTPAARAGLSAGDLITGFDGDKVVSWSDLNWRLLNAVAEHRSITLETRGRDGGATAHIIDFGGIGNLEPDSDFMGRLGFKPFRPQPRVRSINPGSPAAQAGLKVDDVFIAAAGKPVATADDFITAMRANPGRTIVLEVMRGRDHLALNVTPEPVTGKDGAKYGRIGADLGTLLEMTTVSYGPVRSLSRAFGQTWDMSAFSLKMLGKMVIGEVSWRNLSGPVTIADYAGKTARLGPTYFLNFLALVSISLGVINLLPVPMLDGGNLMYYLAEIIRGKPVSERVMEIGIRFGLIVVAVTMVLALYNDINRLLAG